MATPVEKKNKFQLIKVEELHKSRPYLWFGSDGIIRGKQEENELLIGPYFEYNFKKVPTAEYSIKVR